MRIAVQTVLDAPFERIREEAGTPRLLEYVAAPLIRFRPIEPPAFPLSWREGRYLVAMRLFGLVPLGRQWIGLGYPGAEETDVFRIRDDGAGRLARKWDHLITLRARADGRTDYRDEIEIEAGLLTPLVAAFAAIFYRHRQRRWRALVRSGFQYPGRGVAPARPGA